MVKLLLHRDWITSAFPLSKPKSLPPKCSNKMSVWALCTQQITTSSNHPNVNPNVLPIQPWLIGLNPVGSQLLIFEPDAQCILYSYGTEWLCMREVNHLHFSLLSTRLPQRSILCLWLNRTQFQQLSFQTANLGTKPIAEDISLQLWSLLWKQNQESPL